MARTERVARLTSGGISVAVASANQMTPLRKAKKNISLTNLKNDGQ